MSMEWLGAIQWEQAAIVGPVAAALTAGVFGIVIAIMKRKKPPDDGQAGLSTTVSPEITVAPKFNIDNKPSNVFKPTVKVGLDEQEVGQEVSKAVDPLRQGIEALREQLATAQLAPKQPLPDSENPLKVKAVEFYNAGVDAANEHETGQAIGHWLDAVNLDPDSVNAHFNLGVALWVKGDYEAAIEQCNAVLRLDPNFADAHNLLGAVLATQGALDTAIENYNAALRIDANSASAHFNLGCAFARKNDVAAAVSALQKAIELDQCYRARAKSETDYDPIRDDPAFRKLVYGE